LEYKTAVTSVNAEGGESKLDPAAAAAATTAAAAATAESAFERPVMVCDKNIGNINIQ